MSRNFNNTNLTDSSINFNIQNLQTKVDALPTTSIVNTLITNSHVINNLNNLSTIKSFTVKQSFNSDVDITGMLLMSSNYTLNYTSIPPITSNRQIGFTLSTSNLVNFTAVDSYFQLVAITIPQGIFVINYSVNLVINNINGLPTQLFKLLITCEFATSVFVIVIVGNRSTFVCRFCMLKLIEESVRLVLLKLRDIY